MPTTTLPSGHLAWDLRESPSMRPDRQGSLLKWRVRAVVQRRLSMFNACAARQARRYLNPRHCHLALRRRCAYESGAVEKSFVTGCSLARIWSSSCVSVVECQMSPVSPPMAPTIDTDMMKSSSCQPSCLVKRGGSSFNSQNHESALIDSSGSRAVASTEDRHVWSATETCEHEPNDSSVVAAGLQPSGGVSQEGWQREAKVHRLHPVSRTIPHRRQPGALSGAISRVVISTIATATAMSRGLAGSTDKTFTTSVQRPRDRTGLPTVASTFFWLRHMN